MVHFDWINTRIAVGAQVVLPQQADYLASYGFTHMLNCAEEVNACWKHFTCHNLPVSDDFLPKDVSWLIEGAEWVLKDWTRWDAKFYVGCQAGIHRSALMAAGLLVSLGFTPEEAMERICEKRSVCQFPETYQRALFDFQSLIGRVPHPY